MFLALQIGDKHRVTTPVNWKKGDDVIVHPTVTNEEAKTLFPEFTIHKVCSESSCNRPVLNSNVALPQNHSPEGGLDGCAMYNLQFSGSSNRNCSPIQYLLVS